MVNNLIVIDHAAKEDLGIIAEVFFGVVDVYDFMAAF